MFTLKQEEILDDHKILRQGCLWNGLNTPCFITPTSGGSAPFLTPDNVNKLTSSLQCVPFEDICSAVDTMQNMETNLSGYFNFKEQAYMIMVQSSNLSGTKSASSVKTMNTSTGRQQYSPKRYMENMSTLQPQIVVALADDVSHCGKKRLRNSVETTTEWLDVCIAAKPAGSYLCAVVVGGQDERCRRQAVTSLMERSENIDCVLLSGMEYLSSCTMERQNMITFLRNEIPKELPVLVHNISIPQDVLTAIEAGVDLFTGDYPQMLTQFGYGSVFWISERDDEMHATVREESLGDGSKLALRDRKFARDATPILKSCTCFTCRNHSRAYLNHLLTVHEMTASVLLYLHNLHHYLRFFAEIRKQMEAGTYATYKTLFDLHNNATSS